MQQGGFGEVEALGETGFNSSPLTRGMLFRGKKMEGGSALSVDDGLKDYQNFFERAYADGALSRKMKHLIALGASLGAGCEP